MTPDVRAELLLSYARGPALLKDAVAAVPEEALDFKPGPGKWSIREIVFHLLEGELNWYTRARFIMAEPGVTILPYDQDKWVDTLDVKAHSLEDALALIRMLRQLLVQRLRSLPEETWIQFVIHPALGPLDLDRWMAVYEPHLAVHLAQIQRNLAAWKSAAVA